MQSVYKQSQQETKAGCFMEKVTLGKFDKLAKIWNYNIWIKLFFSIFI